MKIQRSISIDADLWLEAKRLPSISRVIQEFLEEYLEYNKEELKKQQIIKKINELENNKKNIDVQLLTLKSILEKNNKKELLNKQKETQKIKELDENKKLLNIIEQKPLSLEEIQYFGNNEPKLETYNNFLFTNYNEEQFNIRLEKYKQKFNKK